MQKWRTRDEIARDVHETHFIAARAPGRETVQVSRLEKQLLPYLSTTASSGIRSLFIFIVVLMVSVWAVAGSKHIFIVGLSFP